MENPIVTIEQGTLKGKRTLDYFGGTYYSFQGIPYAQPPLGELRFKAPRTPKPWDGTRDATIERDGCFSHHMLHRQIVGSEDCLFLNVYTQDLPTDDSITKSKAVMVWIHGGAFKTGSSKTEIYGPDFLISQDVVIVTINYRLGILGFLALEDPKLEVPGNAAFKDMVMALKWIQKNIEKFYGNPNNVTIFGESAGGASVHYLMLSPMAKGLFHKVIFQSGCAINLWSLGSRCAKTISSKLGFESSDEEDILKFLQQVPVDKILWAQDNIPDVINAYSIRPHGPVVEKPHAEESFLPTSAYKLLISGNYNKVPIMTGYTDREGLLFEIMAARDGVPRLTTDFEEFIPYYLNVPKGSEFSLELAQKIKDFYFEDKEVSMENIDNEYLLRTDLFFVIGLYKSIINHLATSEQPIYLYRMTVDSKLNFYKNLLKKPVKGVCHADDLGYLWRTSTTPQIKVGSVEDKTIRRFITLWANFAKNGNPNPAKKDDLIPITWKPVLKKEMNFLDIGSELLIGVNPDAERMAFWKELEALVVEYNY